jgi:plasmid maintenance system antidote protein VapI
MATPRPPGIQLDPVELLQGLIREKYKSSAALAAKLGVSRSYLSELLRGSRQPGPKILDRLGLRRHTVYIQSGRRHV